MHGVSTNAIYHWTALRETSSGGHRLAPDATDAELTACEQEAALNGTIRRGTWSIRQCDPARDVIYFSSIFGIASSGPVQPEDLFRVGRQKIENFSRELRLFARNERC